MDNFERRFIIDYLEKTYQHLDMCSGGTENFLKGICDEFKISSNIQSQFEESLYKRRADAKAEFLKLSKSLILKLKTKNKPVLTSLEKRFSILKDIYKLDEFEYKLFICFVIGKINDTFGEVFDGDRRAVRFACKHYIKASDEFVILNELIKKNILKRGRYSSDPYLNSDIETVINNPKYNTKEKINNYLIGKPVKPKLKLKNYCHIKDKAQTAIDILSASVKEKREGVNILLYGKPGTGKTEFAKLLAHKSNARMYSVIVEKEGFMEADREDRLCDLASKQYLLKNFNNACILFDEAEDVMNTGFSLFYGTASKGRLNNVLETTPVPIIWTTNRIEGVDSAFLRRMTYTIEFEELSNEARLDIWNDELKKNEFEIEQSKVEKLNKTYNVSPSIITNAIKTTKMIKGDADKFEELIESVATVVENKKNIKNLNNFEPEKYDISLVNTDLDMDNLTDKILESGKLNFSLCLYGEPGTGKSEYAKYLADKLGLEVVCRKASDLMSMWVGGTEKNIANAFAEAKNKKAMLIIDEADSFLQNRSNAQRSWEVTQVNEMLTWMESHQYPFVCTTNLMDSLDEASLRRFTFKVKFDFMTKNQVSRALELFFGLKNAAIDVQGLTAGDFATVKKKVNFLGIKDLGEIEKMLSDEVKVKKSPNLKSSIGF